MAVTVVEVPSVVLDEDYRIVEVGPAAQAGFGPLLGQNVFDCFPGSRSLFRPYYEKARRTGRVVEFAQYYDGYVTHVTVIPAGPRLTVHWETLCILDVLTHDGLRSSLTEAIAALEERETKIRREQTRDSLRVVEGGR